MYYEFMANTESDFITRAEAATYMRVSPKCIDDWIKRGFLSKYNLADGRSVRISKSELDAMLKKTNQTMGR